ncbi:NAD(P)-dependent dehydrogenase (short-subunit alcohol dehydrogenase family) [Stella humosa]|uniref:NAD(P)-dependent dehydrogenase (Short-subunit alcohol dehydrogenase family) n=1 Tax=Stella humosa TaxID=94 RepID=A0A3N1M7Z2_9PROT|nr:3-ketoacyl-ACP reductase [Stella humosa]ROP99780.1 NAD(P)-dependent dehydrogenase (short-subunit alcohol dehydrogenase family) [Stella humosa]BBK30993.1 3-ketoacyl-ACP reductase [Stella humosa]
MTETAGGRPVALVTGGRRGIGRGIAYALAESGHDVAINDIVDDAEVAETLGGIAARGGSGTFVRADVADPAGHAALLDAVMAALGPIGLLVNNAGVSVQRRGDLLDMTPESFDRLVTINLRGPFFLTQALARRWLDEGGRRRRAIVTISSVNATMASINRGEYCIAKAGLPMMTRLFALRLAEAGIPAFEIRPGIIRTDMTAPVSATYDPIIAAGTPPARRWGEAEDIGRAVAALASGAFDFSTGEAIHVDGGLGISRL